MTYKTHCFLIFLWLITCNIQGYGQDLFEIDIRYTPVSVISSGLIGIRESIKGTDYYGYMNTKNKIVVVPKYQAIQTFEEGVARVFTYEKKVIFIDTLGHEILKNEFENSEETQNDEFLSAYNETKNYYMRFALFKSNDKYGLVDLKGKTVIPPLYNELINLGEGYAITKLGNIYYCMDSTNTIIQTIEVDEVKESDEFDENKIVIVKHNNLYGAIDKKGNFLIPPIYEQVSEADLYGEDADKYELKVVKLGGKFGCINLSNSEIVLPIEYDGLLGFTRGYFVVKKGERFFIAKMK